METLQKFKCTEITSQMKNIPVIEAGGVVVEGETMYTEVKTAKMEPVSGCISDVIYLSFAPAVDGDRFGLDTVYEFTSIQSSIPVDA